MLKVYLFSFYETQLLLFFALHFQVVYHPSGLNRTVVVGTCEQQDITKGKWLPLHKLSSFLPNDETYVYYILECNWRVFCIILQTTQELVNNEARVELKNNLINPRSV